ncbi:ABC transporter substrate-binding protein [Kiloniella sp.]|uniref:ABC transporter substrate-binding protein n=1 Tax=Kiloniella sp. TaxID=1938587 RepID=UPI003B023852
MIAYFRQALLFVTMTACLILSGISGTVANHLEHDKPIVIAINNWSSQIVLSEVYRSVLERVGYRVIFAPVDITEQWGALGRGRIHAQIEVWEGSQSHQLHQMLAKGLIVSAGTHRATTQEEWWYPIYVEALCPGLPNWKALRKCATIFEGSSDPEKGLYITGPWDKFEHFRIIALDLPFTIKRLRNSTELREEIKKHIAARRPILVYNWTPNWIDHHYPGKFIKFPAYTKECATDPAWGINPNLAYDCGNPIDGWLKKVVWHEFPKVWPCAYNILQRIEANNKMIEDLSLLVNLEGYTPRQAAEKWLEKNPKKWQRWLSGKCKHHMMLQN